MTTGAMAERCLRMIEDTLDEREQRVISRVCGKIGRGEKLEPNEAVQAWLEVHATRQLKTALTTKSKLEG